MKFNEYIEMLLESYEKKTNLDEGELDPNAIYTFMEIILENIYTAIPSTYKNKKMSFHLDRHVNSTALSNSLADELLEQYQKTESITDVAKLIIAYVFEQFKKKASAQGKEYLFNDRIDTKPEILTAIEFGIGPFELKGSKLSGFRPSKEFKNLIGVFERIIADEKV